jgi:hypothetical protein
MLKNKTRDQLKNKFNLKPTLFNTVVREIVYKQNEDDLYNEEKTNKKNNKSAFIDIPNYLEPPVFENSKPLLICLFQIVMEGIEPFILYLLNKTDESILVLPSFARNVNNNISLKREAVDYMNDIIIPFQGKENSEISYAGFMETNENNILFLKYVSLINNTSNQLPVNYYWSTVHELINMKSVYNIPIEIKVTQFFISNRSLLKLKNENEVIYEIPVIGYISNSINCKQVDVYREKRIDKYEKCYYFHINVPFNLTKKSVIRCVLFLKQTGLINDDFSKCNSIVYNKKNCISYYLIKDYEQHTILS